MNRMLITSKDLVWPDIDGRTSETILHCIEGELIKYPEIKRPKTLPKKQREKIKKMKSETVDVIARTESADDTNTNNFKYHFLNGINTITRFLEKPENLDKIMCILVCKSCKRILVQHLLFICSQNNIKAGCVSDLSKTLPKFFNIKTISAIAIRKCYDESFRQTFAKFENIILPLLPNLNNLFGSKKAENENEKSENFEKELMDIDEMQPKKKFKTISDIFIMKTDQAAEIRSFEQSLQFISFNEEANLQKTNLQRFNEKNFILYAEGIVTENQNSIDEQDDCIGIRYFEKSSENLDFKKFDIAYRKPNPSRQTKNKTKKKQTQNKSIKNINQ
jgi:hypothetical protein